MVFCPTTGDDVSRQYSIEPTGRYLRGTRPIDSVLQVWLTRAESASAQLAAAARVLNYC